MISFLSSWIGQIAVSVIIVSIFEIIIPNGNLKKYIKVVLGIYIVYCMITPFVNKNKLFDIDDLDIKKYTTNNISKSDANLKANKENPGIHKIDLIIKNSQNNQIQINEVEIGNSIKQQEKKDINIEQIKQLIADYLEINQNIISIKIK